MVSETIAFGAFGGLVFLLGAAVVRTGYRSRRQATEIEETETSAIADVDPRSEERVEVKGEARAGNAGTVDAHILGSDALAVTTEVEYYRRRSNQSNTSTGRWKTETETTDHVPFLVDDGTGTALVRVPNEADLVLERAQVGVGTGRVPPDPVTDYLQATEEVSADPNKRRRYSQGAILPGEDVYLLVEPLETAPADSEADVILGGEADPDQVIVSDKSEAEVASGRSTGGIVAYAIGGFMILMGLFVMSLPLLASG